jgi:hypothetical protein
VLVLVEVRLIALALAQILVEPWLMVLVSETALTQPPSFFQPGGSRHAVAYERDQSKHHKLH